MFIKKQVHCNHRVIILNRGTICLAKEREETDANFPDQNVQRHSVTSLETAHLLVNEVSFADGEVCVLRSPGIVASPISLCLWEVSVGGA